MTLVTPDQIETYLKQNDKTMYVRLPVIKQDPQAAIGNVIHRGEVLVAPIEEPVRIDCKRDIIDRVKSLNDILDSLVPGLSIRTPPSRPFNMHPDDFGYSTIVDFGYLCLEQKIGEDTITRVITIDDELNAGVLNGNAFSQARSTDLLRLIFVRLFPYWGYVESLMSQDMLKMLSVQPSIFLNSLSTSFYIRT